MCCTSAQSFGRALAADPDNIDILVQSARVDVPHGSFSFVADPIAAFAAADGKLTKALSSVPGHTWLGLVNIFTKRGADGIAECEHALGLDRNLAAAHSIIGRGKTYIGRAEETEAHVGEALRLSPRDTLANIWMTNAGVAKLHLGS
jgi:tetratricopeptide (TPR) repeat protein